MMTVSGAAPEALGECCQEVLNWVEYREGDEVIAGKTLKVIARSGDLFRCSLCGRVLGSCPFCGAEYEFPIILYLDEGRRGMVPLCSSCFESLGLKIRARSAPAEGPREETAKGEGERWRRSPAFSG